MSLFGRKPRTLVEVVRRVGAGEQKFDPALFTDAKGPVTAEQLYVNQKVSDLLSKAEMEQNDYRRSKKPNVFFGPEKRYFGPKFSVECGVFTFDTSVLIASMLGLLVLLHWILRKQLEVRRS